MVFAAPRDFTITRTTLRKARNSPDLQRYLACSLTTKPKYVNIPDLNG
jgi:hypothetical protein